MYAYRFLFGCGRLIATVAREVFVGLKSFGAAAIGQPLPPEAFPPAPRPEPTTPAGRPTTPAGPATGGPGQVGPGPDRPGPVGGEPGAPPSGHPERLIPHVPPTADERRLWSQLR